MLTDSRNYIFQRLSGFYDRPKKFSPKKID